MNHTETQAKRALIWQDTFAHLPSSMRQRIEPVPVLGRQGLWTLPEDIASKIREAL